MGTKWVGNPLSALPKRKNARYLPSKSELVTFKIDKNTRSRKLIYVLLFFKNCMFHCHEIINQYVYASSQYNVFNLGTVCIRFYCAFIAVGSLKSN